ncbi:MAG: hypothetical protein NTX52_08540, partial [Planctomycetota bacterium]|nr:hypothetical protein [Planctomycetota bacterium]
MSKFSWVLLIIAFATIVGCIETKDEFTVNPDGSGKVIHEITFPVNLGAGFQAMGGGAPPEMGDGKPPSGMTGNKPSDPQAQLKDSVREILGKSSGVDAWKDVSYKITDDGKMYFKGTAYFPDINNLKIYSAGFESNMMQLSFTRNGLGEVTIEIKGQEQPAAQKPPPAPAVSEAQLDELVRQRRVQYEQSRAMIQGFFSGLKIEAILHLPGQIKEVSNFERIDDRTVRVAFDGAKMLQIMDRMMQDNAWLKEQIRAGKDPTSAGPNDLEANELLFGQRAPIRVVVGQGAKQLFDYGNEVTAAQANYKNMLGELNLGGVVSPGRTPEKVELPPEGPVGEIAPPAPEEETGMKVVVGGVRLVRFSDFGRGIMPLGQRDGY